MYVFLKDYMINKNRNKDAIDTTEIDLGIDMDTNIKSVSI